jgi:hypothetical protein
MMYGGMSQAFHPETVFFQVCRENRKATYVGKVLGNLPVLFEPLDGSLEFIGRAKERGEKQPGIKPGGNVRPQMNPQDTSIGRNGIRQRLLRTVAKMRKLFLEPPSGLVGVRDGVLTPEGGLVNELVEVLELHLRVAPHMRRDDTRKLIRME